MIRLDNISKQNGHQILFIEASAVLHKGEKVGLVGPNGSGKTTIFRLVMKEEQPDGGQVAVDRGTTIGYFSQDVGEMSGRMRRMRARPTRIFHPPESAPTSPSIVSWVKPRPARISRARASSA